MARPGLKLAPASLQQHATAHPVGRLSTRHVIVLKAVRADQQTETVDSSLLQSIAKITEQVDKAVANTLAASAEAAKAQNLSNDSEVRQKVVLAVKKLQKGLLERETEVSRDD